VLAHNYVKTNSYKILARHYEQQAGKNMVKLPIRGGDLTT